MLHYWAGPSVIHVGQRVRQSSHHLPPGGLHLGGESHVKMVCQADH